VTHETNGYTQRFAIVLQMVTVCALFVAGFWTAVVSPIQVRVNDIEKNSVQIREHEEFKKRIDDQAGANRIDLTNQIVANRLDYISQISNMQRQVDEMKREFGSTFTLGDKVKELQTQLDQLRIATVTAASVVKDKAKE
jgi:hypothetical protein